MQSLARKNIEYLGSQQKFISVPGLLFVFIIHGALFYYLWNQKVIPPPEQMVTLFADLIAMPVQEKAPKTAPEPPPVKLQPEKKPVAKPKQQPLATKAPAPSQKTVVELPPEVKPVVEQTREPERAVVEAPPAQMPVGPVTLTSELSVSCPKLTAPVYPAVSRRMGEEGKLVLRVELDETGRIDNARVVESSGFARLDEAALTTVKDWQCKPAMRDGQPVRAIALQPFNFVLQGN